MSMREHILLMLTFFLVVQNCARAILPEAVTTSSLLAGGSVGIGVAYLFCEWKKPAQDDYIKTVMHAAGIGSLTAATVAYIMYKYLEQYTFECKLLKILEVVTCIEANSLLTNNYASDKAFFIALKKKFADEDYLIQGELFLQETIQKLFEAHQLFFSLYQEDTEQALWMVKNSEFKELDMRILSLTHKVEILSNFITKSSLYIAQIQSHRQGLFRSAAAI